MAASNNNEEPLCYRFRKYSAGESNPVETFIPSRKDVAEQHFPLMVQSDCLCLTYTHIERTRLVSDTIDADALSMTTSNGVPRTTQCHGLIDYIYL